MKSIMSQTNDVNRMMRQVLVRSLPRNILEMLIEDILNFLFVDGDVLSVCVWLKETNDKYNKKKKQNKN